MDTPILDQKELRFRNDDGSAPSEVNATWRQASNDDDSQDVDTVYRIRALIEETAGFALSNVNRSLQYKLNVEEEWNELSDVSSVIRMAASLLDDEADTTQQLGSGTFVDPNAGQEDTSGSAGGPACDFAGNDEVEFEWSYTIISADVVNNDLIHLRVNNMGNYTQDEVVITVIEGGGPAARRRIHTMGLNLPWWLIAPFYPIVWIIRRRIKFLGALLLGLFGFDK